MLAPVAYEPYRLLQTLQRAVEYRRYGSVLKTRRKAPGHNRTLHKNVHLPCVGVNGRLDDFRVLALLLFHLLARELVAVVLILVGCWRHRVCNISRHLLVVGATVSAISADTSSSWTVVPNKALSLSLSLSLVIYFVLQVCLQGPPLDTRPWYV